MKANQWPVAATVGAALLFCCAASYKAAGPPAQRATLTLERGAMHLGAKSLQSYHAFKDDSCAKPALEGRLKALLTYGKTSKDVQVDSGAPIYVQATTTLFGVGPSGDPSPGYQFALTSDSCINLVGFTPVAGHRYRVRQELPLQGGCSIEVFDLQTQSAPDDLVVADAHRCSVL
jgi:hypothetical protein